MARLIDVVENEAARLNALRDLRLLDTAPSEAYDRLTRLASRLLDAPVSTISLTDKDRQWFKSRVGVDIAEIPRAQAPCQYAIQGDGVFVVPDLTKDDRFSDSPLAQAGIRFYAGAPLFTRSGYGLGTLCVIDTKPRDLDGEQVRVLSDLAGMVMSQIELQNMIGRVDPTTGLANQHQMFEELENIVHFDEDDLTSAFLIDLLGREQQVNLERVLGANKIEELLRKSISVIQQNVGNSSKMYHTGPLQISIVLDTIVKSNVRDTADRLINLLSEPIICGDVPVTLEPVCGIYEFAMEVNAHDVLRRLIAASDEARTSGDSIAYFDSKFEDQALRRFRLVHDFGDALESVDQLSLVFQPRVKMSTGKWTGAEALIRWNHHELGNISPGEFIPLIEKTALARPLMDWVAKKALEQIADWKKNGIKLCVSVNASALNLDEPDFSLRLVKALADANVSPEDIELEFTESAVARNPKRVIEQLGHLNAVGIRIAVDDFGTGYSNVSYLQQLPVSVLKIDQSFIKNLISSEKDRKLVHSMILMAHDLGYHVVAEGIESPEIFELLKSWGCDEGQGYFMSRPIPPEALTQQIMERKAA